MADKAVNLAMDAQRSIQVGIDSGRPELDLLGQFVRNISAAEKQEKAAVKTKMAPAVHENRHDGLDWWIIGRSVSDTGKLQQQKATHSKTANKKEEAMDEYMAPAAGRKRHLDEIAPPLSSDGPAVTGAPAKMPHHSNLSSAHPQQQYPLLMCTGTVPGARNFQPMQSPLFRDQQHNAVLANMSSTPAHGPSGGIRSGHMNMMDVQNKSPKKAPAKTRRMSMDFFDDFEIRTPPSLPRLQCTGIPVEINRNVLAGKGHRGQSNSGQATLHASPSETSPAIRPRKNVVIASASVIVPQPLAATVEQKDTCTSGTSRLAKPLAKRAYERAMIGTPVVVEQSLPAISQILLTQGPTNTVENGSGAVSKFGGSFPPFKATVTSASTQAFPCSRNLPLDHPTGSHSAPQQTVNVFPSDSFVQLDLGNLKTEQSDDCSSDEELHFQNDFSLSQEKMQDLSFRDTPDNDFEAESLTLTLCEEFVSILSNKEKAAMEDHGLATISLTDQPSPIMLGRDQFKPVFGENIRGTDSNLISRRHCVFYVTRGSENAGVMSISVMVENTSTNGLEINKRAMKNGERRELHVGDTVTLLEIRMGVKDISLSYVLKQSKTREQRPHCMPSINPKTEGFHSESGELSSDDGVKHEPKVADIVKNASSNPEPKLFSAAHKKHVENGASSSMIEQSVVPPAIFCHVRIANPFTRTLLDNEHSFQQHRGYREELSSILATFSSIDCFKIDYDFATALSVKKALTGNSSILLYAGDGDEFHVIAEDANGMPVKLEKQEFLEFVEQDNSVASNLIVVYTRSKSIATMFQTCGMSHVIFVNAADSYQTRAMAFLRALFAGILRGYPLQKCYNFAEFVALHDRKPFIMAGNELCAILQAQPRRGDITKAFTEATSSKWARRCLPSLCGSFFPILTPNFVGREKEIGEVFACLKVAKEKVQVCTIKGRKGCGKSSIAIYVAKYAHERHWHQNGVHFFPVELIVEQIETDLLQNDPKIKAEAGNASVPLGMTQQEDMKRQVISKFMAQVEELLLSFPSDSHEVNASTLLVFDGCDYFLPSTFRKYVLSLTRKFPGVQILITVRQDMKLNLYHSSLVSERIVQVNGLSEVDSAAVLLALAKLNLSQEQHKKSLPDTNVQDLAKHAALTRLKGNPLLISLLSTELKKRPLNDLKDFASKIFEECV